MLPMAAVLFALGWHTELASGVHLWQHKLLEGCCKFKKEYVVI